MKPIVLIPTYNERETLPIVLDQLAAQQIEVLVVDDGSPDGTAAFVAELSLKNPKIHLLNRDIKSGLCSAYLAGFGWMFQRDYTHAVTMDADLSHDPKDVPRLLGAAARYDVVVGSRYVPGGGVKNWPWRRRALSRGGNLYARWITRVPIDDLTAGFVCYSRETLEVILSRPIHSEGYVYQIEMKHRAVKKGFRVVEIPICFKERTGGVSKMSRQIVLEALWRVWTLR